MEVDMEAEGVSSELGHKKADLEKPTEEERASAAKTPSEDHHDRARRRAMATEYDDDDDEYYDEPLPNPLDAYRQSWARSYGTNGATFEDETDLPPMPNTDIPVLPPSAQPMETMQVFTVKVTQITGGLRWPLGVYGVVAVRDSMDHKRNVLFRRGRNECQTLTSLQDSLLELIGPSRAILLFDNPLFEIDIKVKGQGPPSEDKALSYYAFLYNNICHRDKASYAITKVVPSDNSMMEIKFAHLAYAVEATIAIRIIGGSNSFSARFTARTKSIDEDMVLLDSRGRNVPIADDGLIALQRRIVVVEEKGLLILGVEATQGGAAENKTVVQQLKYRPRQALRSEAFFSLGFSRMHVLVAWSMLP